jgi:hypothetical protein
MDQCQVQFIPDTGKFLFTLRMVAHRGCSTRLGIAEHRKPPVEAPARDDPFLKFAVRLLLEHFRGGGMERDSGISGLGGKSKEADIHQPVKTCQIVAQS